MDESNFFLDTEENLCIIDFAEVALLSESFASYTMSNNNPFIKEVAKYFDLWTRNLKSMYRARELLLMISDRTLGTLICT
jgi:hypothetical protein